MITTLRMLPAEFMFVRNIRLVFNKNQQENFSNPTKISIRDENGKVSWKDGFNENKKEPLI